MMNKRVVGNGSANGNGESKRKRRQITAQSATACFDMSKFKPGKLVFEDGDAFEGYSFGANLPKSGEIVFNTGMVGYPEALTDPSYRKQILILTYPLVGNYGVPGDEKDDIGLPAHFESNNIHVSGLIVSDYSQVHSHWNATRSLSEWLKEHNVPALFGLDTRRLTKKIREKGSMLGKIVFEDGDCEIKDPNKENLVAEVSLKEPKVYGKNGDKTIIAFDCGIKFNIIRYLVNQGVDVHVVPYDYDLKSNPSNITYDGIFISNGPGDPTMAEKCVESIRWAIDGQDKPIFGICLGNQILAL